VGKSLPVGATRLRRDNRAMVVESFGLAILATVVTAIVIALLIRDPRVHQRPSMRSSGSRRRHRHERPRHRRAA
jgi:hypothetical protein